jgi:hypothetical protein
MSNSLDKDEYHFILSLASCTMYKHTHIPSDPEIDKLWIKLSYLPAYLPATTNYTPRFSALGNMCLRNLSNLVSILLLNFPRKRNYRL